MPKGHGPWCEHRDSAACRAFSTDGTRLGSVIAHEFGTTNEEEIIRRGTEELLAGGKRSLTGMDEEQAEWEEGLE